MISQLYRRGFKAGGGMLDPTGTRFLLLVPKNASSYLAELTQRHGWALYNIVSTRPQHLQQVVVVLRDPIQRWISGVAQYVLSYILCPYGPNGPVFPGREAWRPEFEALTAQEFINHYNVVVDRLIFDNPERLDDHVWPQNEIIKLVPDRYDIRMYVIDHIDDELCPYLSLIGDREIPRNDSASSPDLIVLQDFFRQVLHQRPDYQQRLRDYYRDDYDLLASVA